MRKLLVLTLLLLPAPLLAETYQWTDAHGTLNFTEDLGRVPKKYRKRVRVLRDDGAIAPVSQRADLAKAPSRIVEKAAPKSTLYGDKDEKGWRTEFAQLRGDLKLAERDLADFRGRLGDTSRMSRADYLNITNSVKHEEYRVLELRKRLETLNASADQAGVPADFR